LISKKTICVFFAVCGKKNYPLRNLRIPCGKRKITLTISVFKILLFTKSMTEIKSTAFLFTMGCGAWGFV
jgi:hypothetical protein